MFGSQSAPFLVDRALVAWESYRRIGTVRTGFVLAGHPDGEWGDAARAFCPVIDRDSIVSAPDPWTLHLYCGNAAYRIPTDLSDLAWLDRYLDERRPAYLISDGGEAFAVFERSPRLERAAERGGHVLYRVVDADPGLRPWRAPPPLAALGSGQRPGAGDAQGK